jgi:DHA1 family bicyclomycin/chloramphenicol resistance-like MFS transporter
VLVCLFLTMSSFGLVGSNTQASAMNVDLDRTGAISSLLGASSFGVGAILSVVSGAFHDGTARPIAWTMLAMILLSSAALYGMARSPRTIPAGA